MTWEVKEIAEKIVLQTYTIQLNKKNPEETWKRLSKGQRAALKELLNISIWMYTFLKL